jgi:hypothetical protein
MYRLEQIEVLSDTKKLIQLAQTIDRSTVDKLLGKEVLYAWWRRLNFFYQVTPEIERYILYTSLPYCLGLGTKIRLLDIWPDYPFDNLYVGSRHTTRVNRNVCLPTGNIRAEYMILGDTEANVVPTRMLIKGIEIQQQGMIEHSFTRGYSARVMRGALDELHMMGKVWFTHLLKVSAVKQDNISHADYKKHFEHVLREIEVIKPEKILVVGNDALAEAKRLGLMKICARKSIEVIPVKHPYRFRHGSGSTKAYANHLFNVLYDRSAS